MRVIKLGGSLLSNAGLSACLQKIGQLSGVSIITPGGGEFADNIRNLQQRYHFSDVVAHDMAILAMQQMALLMRGLQPALQLCHVPTDSLATGVYVWSPLPQALAAAGIPASWDITSDSLAAWLSAHLNADELIVVKSAIIDPAASIAELQKFGILDAAFHQYAAQLGCPLRIVNQHDFLNHD